MVDRTRCKLGWRTCRSPKVGSLPRSIVQLANLSKLDISWNQLTSLPESIGQLSSLQELDLGYNQLNNLPDSICQLSNLQKLDLSGNQLTILPKSIGQLSSLQKLDLSYNQLTDMSPLQEIDRPDLTVKFSGIDLPRRYWIKVSEGHWILPTFEDDV